MRIRGGNAKASHQAEYEKRQLELGPNDTHIANAHTSSGQRSTAQYEHSIRSGTTKYRGSTIVTVTFDPTTGELREERVRRPIDPLIKSGKDLYRMLSFCTVCRSRTIPVRTPQVPFQEG